MSIRAVHNEALLVTELIAGSEKALAALFNAYHHQLVAYVLTVIPSQEKAIEIVQDVYVKLWMSRDELHKVDKFTAYLFILTRNYTLNCLKKMARDRRKAQQYHQFIYESAAIPDQGETRTDRLALIERAVAQLPAQQQQAYLLSREHGMKYAEIAEKMGLSKESVKKYIHLALKSIAEFVKSHAVVLLILMEQRKF